MKLPILLTILAASLACATQPDSVSTEQRAYSAPRSACVSPIPRNEGWWTDRHALINARVREVSPEILFIGDSITQGWEDSGKEVWKQYYGARKAANLGIGGDRTQHVLWRLNNGNIDGISPRLAVLMIGTNNSSDDSSEDIAGGVRAIITKLRSELPETKILVLGIFPRGADENDVRRKTNERTNALIASMADGDSVDYLDIGQEFLEADGTLSETIMPDLLHLSPEGYGIWARAIESSVQSSL